MVRLLLILGALIALLFPIVISDHESQPEPSVQTIKEVQAYTEDPGLIGTTIQGKVTMYNSVPEQTDSDPFVTASGIIVRAGIVANNCLPFGTDVVIDGVIYEVQDRMASRYGCEWFDIWSASVPEAVEYGVQMKTITIPVCTDNCPLIMP